MKKLVVFICFTFLFATSTVAQDFRFGVKAGLNVASIGGDTFVGATFDTRIAYHVGVFAQVPLLGKLSLQPEVLYSAQGSNFGGILGLSGFDDQKLNYVNVPVLAKYRIIKGLSAEAGPVVGVLISADGRVTDFNGNSVDTSDFYNTIDAGFAIGASYAMDSGFVFGLRYNKGLTNINNSDFTNRTNQNNVFQIHAGYSFL